MRSRTLLTACCLALIVPATGVARNPFLAAPAAAASSTPASAPAAVHPNERADLPIPPIPVPSGGLPVPPDLSSLLSGSASLPPPLPSAVPPPPAPAPVLTAPAPAAGPKLDASKRPLPERRGAPADALSAGNEEPAAGIFPSRDVIESARRRCDVALTGAAVLKVPAAGGQFEKTLRLQGGRGCIQALQATESWVEVDLIGNRVVLNVAPAPAGARQATVYIANTAASLSFEVQQQAR